MKRTTLGILIVVLGVISCLDIHARRSDEDDNTPDTRIFAAYGVLGAQVVIEGLSDLLAIGLTGGIVESGDWSGVGGPITVGVQGRWTGLLDWGIEAGYASFTKTYTYRRTAVPDSAFSYTNTYYHVMGRLDAIWIRGEGVKAYSSVALGAGLLHQSGRTSDDSQSDIFPAFQGTLLGIRFGDAISVFGELGFGFRGLLVVGAAVKL
ncbi:MAG TPA: hypothetical protein PLW14_13415 [Chlorobiota bacterium]|nr:hypothetical protein [Chlorobiota bacterium]